MAGKTSLLVTLVFVSFVGFAGALGCGGSSESPPQPLKTHFDDMYIAQIPLEQKQAVVQAQNDYSVAKMERAKAEADLSEANAAVEVAKNDRKSAGNSLDSAVTNKKQAEASGDQNRVNEAARALRAAELAKKAAEKRVSYLEAYRNWLKKHAVHAEEAMYWREAQYETAKADVAQKNNISPKNFKFAEYPAQDADRQKRAQKAKERAEGDHNKAKNARQEWLRQQAEADEANGRSSDLPDPMGKSESSTSESTSQS